MADLVIAARYITAPEAMVARSLLESEGILAFVPEEHLMAAISYVVEGAGGYRLMVSEDDLEVARDILRDAQLSAS